jgi:uncharacterized protein (TIGR02145 family)
MNGSPVVVENPLPANPDVTGDSRNCPGTVTLSASSSGAVIDWYADDVMTSTLHTGESYTPEIETSTTYYAQARVENTGCLSARVPVSATVNTEGCCTAPGDTVNFTAFSPCSYSTTGDYWYLTDTREENNEQTYKVKKMADGRIWMVQDMKFGDLCDKQSFTGSNGKDQINQVTTLDDIVYYGGCTNYRTTSTPAARGYLYDWAAAINQSGAYYNGSTSVGCSGTGSAANACQGICPSNWHVPTGDTSGEYHALGAKLGCSGVTPCSALTNSAMELSNGGGIENTTHYCCLSAYFTSTRWNNNWAYVVFDKTGYGEMTNDPYNYRLSFLPVRCVRNQ